MDTGVLSPGISSWEGYCMHSMDRFIRSLLLAAAALPSEICVRVHAAGSQRVGAEAITGPIRTIAQEQKKE